MPHHEETAGRPAASGRRFQIVPEPDEAAGKVAEPASQRQLVPHPERVAVIAGDDPMEPAQWTSYAVERRTEAGATLTTEPPQPSWWSLLVPVGGVLGFLAVALFAPDWGEAARRSIGLSLLLGALCLAGGLVALARRHSGAGLGWLGAGATLVALGLVVLPASVVPLHALQAQEDATGGHYGPAYTELRLSGVPACDPRATGDLLAWAGADRAAARYADAVAHLQSLQAQCPGTAAAAAAHAQLGQTRLAWGEQQLSLGEYADAVATLTALADQNPGTPLVPAARQDLAATYLAWADFEHRAGRFASAFAKYQTVPSLYPETRYVGAARDGAAQTLFDWGQVDIREALYDDAVQRYQQLVALFPSSLQAAQAADLLAARQPVVGQLVHRDGSADGGIAVRLSSEWAFGAHGYTSGGIQYAAAADANGVFTLGPVPPGSYLLEWLGTDGRYTTLVGSAGQPLDAFVVAPLRPLTLGALDIDPIGN